MFDTTDTPSLRSLLPLRRSLRSLRSLLPLRLRFLPHPSLRLRLQGPLCGLIALALLASSLPGFAAEEGEQAPDFTLPSIYEGQPDITLSDFRGKVVYLDFWASWCAPCLVSTPLYNELYHRYKDQGLEVVAVNVDNSVEDGLDFLIDTPLDFTIPIDTEGDVLVDFDVVGMPTSYLIDSEGIVRMVHVGFRDGDIEIIETAILDNL